MWIWEEWGKVFKNKVSSDCFEDLKQWRIMLYNSHITDIDTQKLIKISKGKSLYLLIKLFDFITPLKLIKLNESKPEIQINKIWVHYFFTNPNTSIKSFLANTELEMRLTVGLNWNKPVAISTSFSF